MLATAEVLEKHPRREPEDPHAMRKKMAQRIKDVRSDRGMTQAQVAVALGLTPAAYSTWELAKAEPSVDKLARLATILDTTPWYLAFGVHEARRA